jgi:hypothetical protein
MLIEPYEFDFDALEEDFEEEENFEPEAGDDFEEQEGDEENGNK